MTTNASKTQWQYLEKRPSSWRKQLYFKGRRLRPFTVWSTMQIEGMTERGAEQFFYKPQRGQTPRRRQTQGNADLAEDTERFICQYSRFLKEERILKFFLLKQTRVNLVFYC